MGYAQYVIIIFMKLSVSEEVKIVAMLARGDTYANIREQMAEEGRTVTDVTIGRVKNRNSENLSLIKSKLMAIEEADALSIKRKANTLLKKRLEQVQEETEIVNRANKEYLQGDMPHEIYERLMKTMKHTSLPELVSVSKEMHLQSKTENEIAPPDVKDLQALAQAIESGDEVILNQMIFNKKHVDAIPPEQASV